MMSTCSSVPPPLSACVACAAKFAKFAERIEGASSTVRDKRVLLRGLLAKNLHHVTPALPMHLAAPRLSQSQFFGHERNFLSHSHSGFADSASVWDCEGRIRFQSPSTNFHRLRNGASAHINRKDCETNGELLYQKEYGNQSNERENDAAPTRWPWPGCLDCGFRKLHLPSKSTRSESLCHIVTGSKITALVLGWVETLVFRSDSRGFGVAGPFWPYAFAWIVW